MSRPKLLDLFCCEGGAARGYTDAGFDVYGVDASTSVEARYLQSGARWFERYDATRFPLGRFDAIHASPPCKDHTDLASLSGGDGTGWMLPHTIARLRKWHRRTGRPFVVENVQSASTKQHMDGAVMLCGSMFDLGAMTQERIEARGELAEMNVWRCLKRHRLFLASFAVLAPPDQCARQLIGGVYGTGGGGRMTRGYKFNLAESRLAMEMPWASRDGCSQAIPPAFARFLGELMMRELATPTGGAR